MITKTIRIGGMTCVNCQSRIQARLQGMAGVHAAAVDFRAGTAVVTFDEQAAAFGDITRAIEELGYSAADGEGAARGQVMRTAGVLIIVVSLFALMRGLGVSAMSSAFPLARAGMSYGMLFVVGLITSVHCIAMCGGINLSQTLRAKPALAPAPPLAPSSAPLSPPLSASLPTALAVPHFLMPALLYNAGRVLSYTAAGFLAGALGSVITVSGRFQGAVQIAAGVFMVIMGVNMLGIFPFLRRITPRLPAALTQRFNARATAGKGPFVIGLLNGLMPCGPLQAMQLYALSTGSPVLGALSMFLFSAGTVPLMFGIGALGSLLSGKTGARVVQAGAVLITAMGLTMFSNGWNLGGFASPFDMLAAKFGARQSQSEGAVFEPVIQDGVQLVGSTLRPGQYPAITVRQGIPVRWTINAPQGSINGCNNRMIIREYGIEHSFKPGDNVIEFTPARTGRFAYSCWMGMIRSAITVVAEGEQALAVQEPDIAPKPAGVTVPADSLALAEVARGVQQVGIALNDDGIIPAVIVVQRGVRALWTITNDSLDPGNGALVFPAYYQKIDMTQGANTIEFLPDTDFAFSTADNVFYGYVKVVDDITTVDIDAVKQEVSEYETLIYPDAYFEAGLSAAGGSCCS